MTKFRHFVGSTLSLLWSRSVTPLAKRTQVLMYHSIGGSADGDHRGIYSLSPNSFVEEMELLKEQCVKNDLKIVPFGDEVPGSLSLTFDDGYRDNLHIAAPLMEKFGFPFHIFLNPTLIESGRDNFLSIEDIRQLSTNPLVSLGLHGYSHEPLTSLSTQSVLKEVELAKSWFEDVVNRQATTFSYPHGSVDDRIAYLIKQCGFTVAACSKFGPITMKSDRLRLPRIDVWSTDTRRSFVAKLEGRWDWMKWRT